MQKLNSLYQQVHDLSCEYLVLEQDLVLLNRMAQKAADGKLHGEMKLQLIDRDETEKMKDQDVFGEALLDFANKNFASILVAKVESGGYEKIEGMKSRLEQKRGKYHFCFSEAMKDDNTLLLIDLLVKSRKARQQAIETALGKLGVSKLAEHESSIE